MPPVQSTQASALGTSLSAVLPSTPAVGGRLVAVCFKGSAGSESWNTPSGWAAAFAQGTNRPAVFTRNVQSGDGTSWTFSISGTTSRQLSLYIFELPGTGAVDRVVPPTTAFQATSYSAGPTDSLTQPQWAVMGVGLGATSGGGEAATDAFSLHPFLQTQSVLATKDVGTTVSDVVDSFARTTSNGWGTSTSGHAYTTYGGSSPFSTNGSVGLITTGADSSRGAFIGSNSADRDTKVRFQYNAAVTGSSILQVQLFARHVDSNNTVNVAWNMATSQMWLSQRLAGVLTSIGTITVADPGTATWRWFRVQTSGATVRAKVWADGASEPTAWDLEATTSVLGSGQGGLQTYAGPGSTNTPVFTFDDLSITHLAAPVQGTLSWTTSRTGQGFLATFPLPGGSAQTVLSGAISTSGSVAASVNSSTVITPGGGGLSILRQENYENAAAGADLSSGNSTFTAVVIGNEGEAKFVNSPALVGNRSLRVNVQSGADSNAYGRWELLESEGSTSMWARLIVVADNTTVLGSAARWIRFISSTGVLIAALQVRSDRRLIGIDSGGSSTGALTTTAIPTSTSTPIRVEVRVVSHGTAGEIEIRVWNSALATTAANETVTATGLNTLGSPITRVDVGRAGASAVSVPTGPLYLDSAAISSSGWIGSPTASGGNVVLSGNLSTSASASSNVERAWHLYPYQWKPLRHGLMNRGGIPAVGIRSWVRTWNPEVDWADVQPNGYGTAIVHPNPIDSAITNAQSAGLKFRLRFRCGVASPSWAYTMSGGSITYTEPQSGITVQVPRWFTEGYKRAVRDVFTKLAEEYDDVSEVTLIFATGAMTYYAEPFVKGVSGSTADHIANRNAYLAAGYTKELDKAAILHSLDALLPFRKTRVSTAYNEWQYVNADGTGGSETTFTGQVMDYQRQLFPGSHIQNNSIREAYITSPPASYALIEARGKPVHFQTATWGRISVLQESATTQQRHDALIAVMDHAMSQYGASGIELPEHNLSNAELTSYDAALVAQAQGTRVTNLVVSRPALSTQTDRLLLSWDPVTAITSPTYQVERNGVIVATGITGTTLTDTGLAPGTLYSYRVRAVS